MTVFAPTPIEYDLASVKPFGQISYVNHRYVYGDELKGEALPPAFSEHMKRVVSGFDPEQDYLLIGGDHLQLVALAAMLGAEHQRFRVLRWDRYARAYYPAMVNT